MIIEIDTLYKQIVMCVIACIYSYLMCVYFSRIKPEKCIGNIKLNGTLAKVLLLILFIHNKKIIPIYSVLHIIILQLGVIIFIISVIHSPNESFSYFQIFVGVALASAFLSFFGAIICQVLRIIIDKLKNQ